MDLAQVKKEQGATNSLKIPNYSKSPNQGAAAPGSAMERSISVSRNLNFKAEGLDENDFHQGYLQKQQPDFFKSWQKRFFVLSQRMLKY